MCPTMREIFKHHHRLTEAERAKLWSTCIFVFDTNSLLNIYRYNSKTRNDFLKIFKKLRDRSWIPYQVAKEFYKNRLDVIQDQKRKFSELDESINATFKTLRDGKFAKSTFLKIDEIEKIISPGIDAARKLIDTQKQDHPDLILHDPYLEELVDIVGDNIGIEPTSESLAKLYDIAEERISKQVPPGYLDSKKQSPQKYGDVLIWFEILEHAKSKSLPIVLITDDDKDDWWQKPEGRKLGPRPELREEMQKCSGVEFYLFNPSYLLENAKKELQIEISEDSIKDANLVSIELNASVRIDSRSAATLSAYQRSDLSSANTSIAWIRHFGAIAEQAVMHWLPVEYPSGVVAIDKDHGVLDFTVETESTLIGIAVKAFKNYNPMVMRSRMRELNLRAFHLIAKNRIDDFSPIFVFETQEEAQKSSSLLNSAPDVDPYYQPIVGYVNSMAIFEKIL